MAVLEDHPLRSHLFALVFELLVNKATHSFLTHTLNQLQLTLGRGVHLPLNFFVFSFLSLTFEALIEDFHLLFFALEMILNICVWLMQWSIQKRVIGRIISVLSQRRGNLREKAQLEEELEPIFFLVEISKNIFCRWSGIPGKGHFMQGWKELLGSVPVDVHC